MASEYLTNIFLKQPHGDDAARQIRSNQKKVANAHAASIKNVKFTHRTVTLDHTLMSVLKK